MSVDELSEDILGHHATAVLGAIDLLQPEQSVDSSSLTRTGTGSSFTVSDKQHTASTAFEAGIPVVSSLAELQGMEDEDEESYNRQASPRHSSAHPWGIRKGYAVPVTT